MDNVTELKDVGSARIGEWMAFWEVGAGYIDVFHEPDVQAAGGPVKVEQAYRRDLVTVQAVDVINAEGDLSESGELKGGQSSNAYVHGRLAKWVEAGNPETILDSV